MAFKMKGNPFKTGRVQGTSAFKQTSPLRQVGPVDKKNPPVGEGEHPDTWVYEGSDLQERIFDLEDRISFIEEDIWNQDGEATDKQKKDLQKLKQELAILIKEKKNKQKKSK